MKNQTSSKLGISAVLVSCLILSASCLDLTLNVLKDDVVTYNVSYLQNG